VEHASSLSARPRHGEQAVVAPYQITDLYFLRDADAALGAASVSL
jgi:hypothetical protein